MTPIAAWATAGSIAAFDSTIMPSGTVQVISEVNFSFGASKQGYQWRASIASPCVKRWVSPGL